MKKIKSFILTLLLIMVWVIIVFAFVIAGDQLHSVINAFFDKILPSPRHFSGEVWYNNAVSIVNSLPGLIISVVALVQTQRLHELEDRYHRPSLCLELAELSIGQMEELYENRIGKDYKKYIETLHAENIRYDLGFKIQFDVENNIVIKRMRIEQIDLIFHNKKYSIQCNKRTENNAFIFGPEQALERSYDRGKMKYTLTAKMYPFEFVGHTLEEECWNDVRDFTRYEFVRDVKKSKVQARFWINMSYEYSKEEQLVLLHTEWDHNSEVEAEFRKNYSTDGGYFEYDVKIKKRGKKRGSYYDKKADS